MALQQYAGMGAAQTFDPAAMAQQQAQQAREMTVTEAFASDLTNQAQTASAIEERINSLLLKLRGPAPMPVGESLNAKDHPGQPPLIARIKGTMDALRSIQARTHDLLNELSTII